MQINLNEIDKNSFKVKEDEINGNKVFLINPADFDCKWTKDNLRFRSLLVDKDGQILSHSLPKFFNFTEKPDLYPNPENFNDLVLEDKIDGSLVCADWIFGSLNLRTRGTVNYKILDNAADFDFIIKKYPNIESVYRANPDDTLLFEITTPNNIIVLRYENEPEIRFLGFIHKKTGLYFPAYSEAGREYVKYIGCKIPEIFKIKGSISDINENIKKWEGKEGCVLKYNNSQNFIKFKSLKYLQLHSLKAGFNSIENLIDLFISQNYPSYEDFFLNISNMADYEIATNFRGQISKICDAYKEVKQIESGAAEFINKIQGLTRKEQAAKILASYGDTNRASFIFCKLDGKPWDEKIYKKLLFQCLKD